MQDLVEVTHSIHYENFRVEKLGHMVETWNKEQMHPHTALRSRKS